MRAHTAGEWITATGEWVNDGTHGQQFKAHCCLLRTSRGQPRCGQRIAVRGAWERVASRRVPNFLRPFLQRMNPQ